MTQPSSVTKTVTAEMAKLRQILYFVTEQARLANLPAEAVYHCKLAVDEAATNIIEHAYEHQAGDITVEVLDAGDQITISLTDSGTPFDPYSVPVPDLTASLEQRTPGGLGIFLIHRVMDEVRYMPGPPLNQLVMVKRK